MNANVNPNEQSSDSQCKRILEYLKEGETITALEALKLFQCFRLASRMTDLKNDDVPFESVFIETPTKKRVKAYYLPDAFEQKHKLVPNMDLPSQAALYAENKIRNM